MNLAFKCQSCGAAVEVASPQIGQTVKCKGCGATATVRAPKEVAGAEPAPAPVLKFACPACGRKFSTKPEMAGKKIRCSGCGAGVRVPGAASSTGAPASRPELKTHTAGAAAQAATKSVTARANDHASPPSSAPEPDGQYSLLEELASVEESNRSSHAEPVLPSRSEMIERARQQTEPEAAPSDEKAPKAKKKGKKKKKKKKTGYFDPKETLQLVAGVCAFVAVLAFVAWRFPGSRFPVGGLLCVMGFIVYLMGAFSLRQLVAEEGVFQALLFRFFPPYQLWFVATHWDEAKDFFAFFAAGLVAMALGGGIIKTSPQGKLAEASDRAFKKAQQPKEMEVPPVISIGGEDDQ
jgi:DNA-directed RNA polymerase subunit RPC12/RpoP